MKTISKVDTMSFTLDVSGLAPSFESHELYTQKGQSFRIDWENGREAEGGYLHAIYNAQGKQVAGFVSTPGENVTCGWKSGYPIIRKASLSSTYQKQPNAMAPCKTY